LLSCEAGKNSLHLVLGFWELEAVFHTADSGGWGRWRFIIVGGRGQTGSWQTELGWLRVAGKQGQRRSKTEQSCSETAALCLLRGRCGCLGWKMATASRTGLAEQAVAATLVFGWGLPFATPLFGVGGSRAVSSFAGWQSK